MPFTYYDDGDELDSINRSIQALRITQHQAGAATPLRHITNFGNTAVKPIPIRPSALPQAAQGSEIPTLTRPPKAVSFAGATKEFDEELQAQLHTDWIVVHQAVMTKKEAIAIDLLREILRKYNQEYQCVFLNLSDKINRRGNPTGRTLLHWTIAQQGKYQLIEALISLGAAVGFDLNSTDNYGQTPLDMVLSRGSTRTTKRDPISIVQLLLSAKANPTKHFRESTPSQHRMTPLHFAIQSRWTLAAHLLVQQIVLDGGHELLKIALRTQDGSGQTPYDAAQNNPEILALFNEAMRTDSSAI